MATEIIVNADDYGLSRGITDHILDSVDNGALNSVSIIANGQAFEYAIAEYKKRSGIRLSAHLNFVEGRPLSSLKKVDLLVNSKGNFKYTFVSLWLRYLTSRKRTKERLKSQITIESAAQLRAIQDKFTAEFKVNVDSHQHVHLLPFVFDSILNLHDKFNFSYIRLPKEPWFFPFGNKGIMRNYLGSNIIKHFLLNLLSRWNRHKLVIRENITYPDHFIGVLFSGNMNESSVKTALSKVKKGSHDKKCIELLLHPGGAYETERHLWGKRGTFYNFYYSPKRDGERAFLKSGSFKEILSHQEVSLNISSKLPGEIVKYIITGTTAAIVHLGFLYILTEFVGMWYILSVTLAFLIAFGVSFTLQKFWTFNNDNVSAISRQLSLFLLTALVSLTINIAGVYLLVEYFKIWYMLAQFTVLVSVALTSFLVYKFVIFKA